MKVEIKNIKLKDIDCTAELLTRSFVSDKGVMILFKENEAKYNEKVYQWFKATIKMLIDNNQIINCAFWGDEHVGFSHPIESKNSRTKVEERSDKVRPRIEEAPTPGIFRLSQTL